MIPLLCVAVSAAALYYVFHLPELLVSGPEKTRASYLADVAPRRASATASTSRALCAVAGTWKASRNQYTLATRHTQLTACHDTTWKRKRRRSWQKSRSWSREPELRDK